MITIEQHYEENMQVARFQFVKVGLTLRSDKPLKDPQQVEEHSDSLLEMAKSRVQAQLKLIKEERA